MSDATSKKNLVSEDLDTIFTWDLDGMSLADITERFVEASCGGKYTNLRLRGNLGGEGPVELAIVGAKKRQKRALTDGGTRI